MEECLRHFFAVVFMCVMFFIYISEKHIHEAKWRTNKLDKEIKTKFGSIEKAIEYIEQAEDEHV